jgi:hypothetical protein
LRPIVAVTATAAIIKKVVAAVAEFSNVDPFRLTNKARRFLYQFHSIITRTILGGNTVNNIATF